MLVRDFHDLRGEPVAVSPAVRHHEPHIGGPELPQAPHRDRASGRAVGVVVAHHHDARGGLDGVVEQCGRAVEIEQPLGREQARERMVEIVLVGDGAGRQHPAQHGMAMREKRRTGHRCRAALNSLHAGIRASRRCLGLRRIMGFLPPGRGTQRPRARPAHDAAELPAGLRLAGCIRSPVDSSSRGSTPRCALRDGGADSPDRGRLAPATRKRDCRPRPRERLARDFAPLQE